MDNLVNSAENSAVAAQGAEKEENEKEEEAKKASNKIKTPEIPLKSEEKPLRDVFGFVRETDVVNSSPGAILAALHAIELTPIEKARTNEERCESGDSARVHWTASFSDNNHP